MSHSAHPSYPLESIFGMNATSAGSQRPTVMPGGENSSTHAAPRPVLRLPPPLPPVRGTSTGPSASDSRVSSTLPGPSRPLRGRLVPLQVRETVDTPPNNRRSRGQESPSANQWQQQQQQQQQRQRSFATPPPEGNGTNPSAHSAASPPRATLTAGSRPRPRSAIGDDVEELCPLHTQTRPVERFFVEYNPKSITEEGQNVDAINDSLDEDKELFDRFAEYTDDDSFFSSSSDILKEDPRRMQVDPLRGRVVRSVFDTLNLRSFTKGRVPQEIEDDKRDNAVWLHQVHRRAIALHHSSFFVFPPGMKARVVVYNVLHHWLMEVLILISILTYSILTASWSRNTDPLSKPDYIVFVDTFFTVLYAAEIVLKLFASGVIMHQRAFFRSPWHWLDMAVLVLMIMNCTEWSIMWNFTAFRLIRIIKSCTYVPLPVRMKLLAKSFLRSSNKVIQVTAILLYALFFFALLGMQLFGGKMHYRCVNTVTGIASRRICQPSATGDNWFYWGRTCKAVEACTLVSNDAHYDFRCFEHMGHALLSTFHIMTFQKWSGLLQDTSDAVGVVTIVYYVFVIIFCAWFIPSLYLGVFIEKIDRTRRLFVQKQLQLFDSMVLEQRQRLNAASKLCDFIERDESGKLRRNPLYMDPVERRNGARGGSAGFHTTIPSGNSDVESLNGGGERSIKKRTKWTDEQRIQLHLSLTRQRDVSDAAERKKRDILRVGSVGTSAGGTTSNGGSYTGGVTNNGNIMHPSKYSNSRVSTSGASRPLSSYSNRVTVVNSVPPTVASGGDFALGGRVGDVQHHQSTHTIGKAHGTSLPLAVRLGNEQERLRFLEQYQNFGTDSNEDTGNVQRVSLPPLAARDTSAGSRRVEEMTAGHPLATRESRGAIPNRRTPSRPMSSASNALQRSFESEAVGSRVTSRHTLPQSEPQELLINDPEGGDFRFANTCAEWWAIVRNIIHMFTEGYPRILTQYIWEHKTMQRRFGLMPLNYVNKYEDAAMRKLRQRRVRQRRRQQQVHNMYNNNSTRADDDYDNDDNTSHERMYREMGSAKNRGASTVRDSSVEDYPNVFTADDDVMADRNLSPICMANNIVENAPITVFNGIMFFIIFANGVMNSSKHYGQPEYWDDVLFYSGLVFTSLFFIELSIRFVAVGLGSFFSSFFNILDLTVTILGFIELGVFRTNAITVLNWVRFLRLFRMAPFAPMRRVTRVLLRALPDILYAHFFFLVYMFMWLLIGMSLFGNYMGQVDGTHDNYKTRGQFDTFFQAAAAVSQAFSHTREEWLYISWNGMQARGDYTIIYFIVVPFVAFIFRYLFVAVFTWAWQCEEEREEREETAMHVDGPRSAPRLRWFDFTVWRSFKHIHGGFERRDVAPDEVYHLNKDMRRQLRIAEAKERFTQKNILTGSRSASGGGIGKQQLSLSNTSGIPMASYHPSNYAQQQATATTGLSVINIPPFIYAGGQLIRQASLPNAFGGSGVSQPRPPINAPISQFSGQNAELHFARRYKAAPVATSTLLTLPQQLPSAPAHRSQSPPLTLLSDGVYDGNFLDENSAERSAGSRRGVSRGHQSADGNRRSSVAGHFVTIDYVRRPGSMGRGESPALEDDVAISESAQGAGGERVYEHILLPGPRLRYKHVLVGRRRRVFERCLDCNTHKQMVLRAPPNVQQRTVDELHAEHCHMAAVRSSKQLVLNVIIGYVRLQKEMGAIPTREAVETVLGQAWSCGMLLFETIEYLTGTDIEVREHRTWDRTLEALELQQWLVGLHVGEEQVGRATLAYILAHQKTQEKVEEELSFSHSWRKRSFFIFSPSNPIRRAATNAVDSSWFEWLIIVLVFMASICLCFYAPFDDQSRGKYTALSVLDGFFSVLFAIEMLLKWLSKGVILDVHEAYFWHRWNIFDFFITIVSLLGLVPGYEIFRSFKVMRCFRILGPLRFCKFNRELSTLAVALWGSVPTVANVLLLCLINYIVWSILAVRLFMGKAHHCSAAQYLERSECINESAQWITTQRNFDNFPQSLLTMFEVSAGSKWLDVIHASMDSWSTEQAPITDYQPYNGLFFLAYYYVSNFVLFSLFIASIIYCYLLAKNYAEGVVGITYEHQLWIHMQRMILRLTPRVRLLPMNNPVSRFFHRIVTHRTFDIFMGIVLFLNMITMSLYWYGMSPVQENVLDMMQYAWVGFFSLEIIMRLMAHGLRAFTRQEFCFEFFVLLLSYLQIGLHTFTLYRIPFNVNVLRVLRFGRVLKSFCAIFPVWHHLLILREVLVLSLPIVVNVTLILILGVFIFAVLGLHIIGRIIPEKGWYIDGVYNNFLTFPNSLIMTFRLATLENWVSMLRSSILEGNTCSTTSDCGLSNWTLIFYVAILICFALMIVSLYLAVVVDNYVAVLRMNVSVSRIHDLHRFRELWSVMDPNATLIIRTRRLPELLESLRPPLGLSSRRNRVELLRLMREYDIPDHGGKIHYHEVLIPLARRILAMSFREFELEDHASAFEDSWRYSEKSLRALPTVLVNYSHATVAQYFAASYVQAAYRRDKARRLMYKIRSDIWREARAVCDELGLPYADYGFGSVSLAGEDPRLALPGYELPAEAPEAPEEEPQKQRIGTGTGTGIRSVSPKDYSEGNTADLEAVLPCVYQPANEDREKLFGPDVPNAVRRHETRSEKMRRKEEQQQQQQQQQPPVSDSPLPMASKSLRSQQGPDYQPPLGTDPESWLNGERKRRPSQMSQGSLLTSTDATEQQ